MKNLVKFKENEVPKEALENIKGGLRYFTYEESMYTFYRNLLSALKIAYSHGHEIEKDGRKHYCIEW